MEILSASELASLFLERKGHLYIVSSHCMTKQDVLTDVSTAIAAWTTATSQTFAADFVPVENKTLQLFFSGDVWHRW